MTYSSIIIISLNDKGTQQSMPLHVINEHRQPKSGISSNLSGKCLENICRGIVLSGNVLIPGRTTHKAGILVDTSS